MKVIIIRNTSIKGESVKADLKKEIEVDDATGWQLIGAGKAKQVVEEPEAIGDDDMLAELEAMESACKDALKEKDDAHEAAIVALKEGHEAILAEKATEISKLKAELAAAKKK